MMLVILIKFKHDYPLFSVNIEFQKEEILKCFEDHVCDNHSKLL